MIDTRKIQILVLLSFCIAVVHAALAAAGADQVIPEDEEVTKFKAKVYAGISADDEIGFKRMGPTQKGQWLATQDEYPQTLDDYQERKSNIRPTKDRRTIVIQPLGTFSPEQEKVVESLKDYTEAFFQLPVRLEKALPLTSEKHQEELSRNIPLDQQRNGHTIQYLAEPVMKYILTPKIPKDAVVYLGITMEDLAAQDLNYVFGLGSLKKRIGIYSLCRYYPEFWGTPRQAGDDRLALTRACKILNHETGHLFGLPHCVFYDCSMNGSNSLKETDEHPVHFCPICQRKLQWNISFDQNKQFEDLMKFYKKQGLLDEALWTEQRLSRWPKIVLDEERQKKENPDKNK